MNKRRFISQIAVGAALPLVGQASPVTDSGPALVTLTGTTIHPNRGPFDPAFDQLMSKQKISFQRAHAFTFAMLTSLPAHTIKPTLEYDGKAHSVKGPLLVDVVRAASAPLPANASLVLRALDGYAVTVSMATAEARRFIIATHLDGRPMALGGLGPLWALFDANAVPEIFAKPLSDRFADCPWGLYHIEVHAEA